MNNLREIVSTVCQEVYWALNRRHPGSPAEIDLSEVDMTLMIGDKRWIYDEDDCEAQEIEITNKTGQGVPMYVRPGMRQMGVAWSSELFKTRELALESAQEEILRDYVYHGPKFKRCAQYIEEMGWSEHTQEPTDI